MQRDHNKNQSIPGISIRDFNPIIITYPMGHSKKQSNCSIHSVNYKGILPGRIIPAKNILTPKYVDVPLCQWKGKIKSNPIKNIQELPYERAHQSVVQRCNSCGVVWKPGYQGKSTVSHVFPCQTCHLGCIPHFQTHAHIPTSSILFLFESMLTIPPFDGPSRFSPANEPPPSWTISRKPDSRITARTGVLPGEVRFDCAGPVFYEIRDVVHLPRWMTRLGSKTRNPKP